MPDNEKHESRIRNWQYRGIPVEERFRSRYVVTDSGCWRWQWQINSFGYAIIGYKGKQICAHVLSYLLHKGEIPEGFDVDHLCSNKACVNPDHLEAVTHQVNVARGSLKKRQSHCHRGHLLEGDNLGSSKNNLRYCKQCNRDKATAYYDKVRKGRKFKDQLTHCPKGHPYSGENLIVNSSGSKTCRECHRAAVRRSYARQHAI